MSSLEIEGPDVVCSHMRVSLSCLVSLTNVTDDIDVTREATWGIMGGEGFVTITNGTLYLNEDAITNYNDIVQFHVKASYGGRIAVHEMEAIPTESDSLDDLKVIGDDALGSHMIGRYSCVATWFTADDEDAIPEYLRWSFDDGSTNIAGVASVSQAGVLEPFAGLQAETNVILYATYRDIADPVGEIEVTLTPAVELEPMVLDVEGAELLAAGKSADFTARLVWSNFAEEALTNDPRLVWSLYPRDTPNVDISSGGRLTVSRELATTGSVYVCAAFTQNGQTVACSNEVSLLDAEKLILTRLDLHGPKVVAVAHPGSTASYSAYGFWTDGTVSNCNDVAVWSVNSNDFVSVERGVLRFDRAVDREMAIEMTVALDGFSRSYRIQLIPMYMRTIDGLDIYGADEVYARKNTKVQYTCLASFNDYTEEDYTTNVTWSLRPSEISASFAHVYDQGYIVPESPIPCETNLWLLAEYGELATSNGVSILNTDIEIVGPEELCVMSNGLYRCGERRSSLVVILIREKGDAVGWRLDDPSAASLEREDSQAWLVPNRRLSFGDDEYEIVLTVTYNGMTNDATIAIVPGRNPWANPDVPPMVLTGYDDGDFDVAATAKRIVAFAMRMTMESETEGRATLQARIDGTYNARKGTLAATVTPAGGKPVKFAAGELSVANGVATGTLRGKKDETSVLTVRITPQQMDGTLTIGEESFPVRGGWDAFANKKDSEARSLLADYVGTYNVAMPVSLSQDGDESDGLGACPAVGGYLSVSVDGKSGKGKVSGVLGDGTKISSSVALCTLGGLKEAETNGVCMPIVVPLNSKVGAFTGVLWLHRDKAGIAADFNTSCCSWYAYWHNVGKKFRVSDDRPYAYPAEYEALLSGKGGAFSVSAVPGELIVTGEVDLVSVPDYYVKVKGDYETLDAFDAALPYGLRYSFAGGKLIARQKSTKPKKCREDGESWYEYAGATDSALKLAMNRKSGVLTGSFKLWYDGTVGEKDTMKHKSFSAKSYGAWVPEVGGYFFGVVSENDPDRKPYRLKRCLPFVLIGEE